MRYWQPGNTIQNGKYVIEATLGGGGFEQNQYPTSECYPQIPNDRYHSTISRYHCLLDINPPDIRIKDLGSLHGTYVSGKLIGKRKIKQKSTVKNEPQFFEYDLQNNDEIKLSHTVFRVNIETEITTNLKLERQITPPKLNLKGFMRDLLERAHRGEPNLRSIKNYAILDKLGAGGFSEVYLARHQKTQELVAIKIMLPKVAANRQKINLFLREIKNTQNLQHPHVIRLKDYCFTDGIFFCTLEYCPGGTVLDLMKLRGGKLAPDEAVSIVVQVLDALNYAHGGIALPKPLADLIDLALIDNPQIYFRNAKAFKTALLSVMSSS